MDFLSNADGLIIDLRKNTGGTTEMVEVTKGAANPGRFFRIKEKILLLVATGYIQKLKQQIADTERLVKQDIRKGEVSLNRVADEWFGKEYINRYFFLSLGDTYRDRGDSRMAILIYKQVPRFYPDYPTGYRKLVDLYWTLDEKESALKYLVKLLELNPNDRTTLDRINRIQGR